MCMSTGQQCNHGSVDVRDVVVPTEKPEPILWTCNSCKSSRDTLATINSDGMESCSVCQSEDVYPQRTALFEENVLYSTCVKRWYDRNDNISSSTETPCPLCCRPADLLTTDEVVHLIGDINEYLTYRPKEKLEIRHICRVCQINIASDHISVQK